MIDDKKIEVMAEKLYSIYVSGIVDPGDIPFPGYASLGKYQKGWKKLAIHESNKMTKDEKLAFTATFDVLKTSIQKLFDEVDMVKLDDKVIANVVAQMANVEILIRRS